MNLQDAIAIYEAELKRLQALDGNRPPHLAPKTDWLALLRREVNTDWLVANIWPRGRQCHLHAARKTGKSLISLWIACELSCGRDPFTGQPQAPVKVGYLDFEMTEDDLAERIEEMGYTVDNASLLDNLSYYLHPNLPKFDTAAGGEALLETLAFDGVQAVVIDTMSRVVAGDENSNDTYIRFYNHTGALLKSDGIAMLRLDHEGHEAGRSRGASAKADDVDIVWQLREVDNGLQFVRKASRISWIPETLSVVKQTEPTLRFHQTHEAWPAGTLEKVKELDDCNVPIDAGRRKVADLLREANITPGRNAILTAAIRYRQTRILGI